VYTGDITFNRCTFSANRGSALSVYYVVAIDNVSLRNCTFTNEYNNPYPLLLSARHTLLEDCYIDTGTGYIDATPGVQPEVKTTLRRCRIKSSGHGLVSTTDRELLIEECEFIGTHEAPSKAAQPYLTNLKCRFLNNRVFRPAKAFIEDPTVDYNVIALVQVKEARNNRFETDLEKPKKHFAVRYDPKTVVVKDRFPSGDFFRPRANAPQPPGEAFSQGDSPAL
jgi:hypothetical protein